MQKIVRACSIACVCVCYENSQNKILLSECECDTRNHPTETIKNV